MSSVTHLDYLSVLSFLKKIQGDPQEQVHPQGRLCVKVEWSWAACLSIHLGDPSSSLISSPPYVHTREVDRYWLDQLYFSFDVVFLFLFALGPYYIHIPQPPYGLSLHWSNEIDMTHSQVLTRVEDDSNLRRNPSCLLLRPWHHGTSTVDVGDNTVTLERI